MNGGILANKRVFDWRQAFCCRFNFYLSAFFFLNEVYVKKDQITGDAVKTRLVGQRLSSRISRHDSEGNASFST